MVSYWFVNVFSPCFVEVAGVHVCKLWRNTLCDYCRPLGFHGETTGWFSGGTHSALEEKPDCHLPAYLEQITECSSTSVSSFVKAAGVVVKIK